MVNLIFVAQISIAASRRLNWYLGFILQNSRLFELISIGALSLFDVYRVAIDVRSFRVLFYVAFIFRRADK